MTKKSKDCSLVKFFNDHEIFNRCYRGISSMGIVRSMLSGLPKSEQERMIAKKRKLVHGDDNR